jgi:hypothetical protein
MTAPKLTTRSATRVTYFSLRVFPGELILATVASSTILLLVVIEELDEKESSQ